MHRFEKVCLFCLVAVLAVGLSGCTDNGVGSGATGGTVDATKTITTLNGTLFLPTTLNADLLASARLSSGTAMWSQISKQAQAYVNGRVFPITVNSADLSFSIPNVPISHEYYRIEVSLGKIGLKTQVTSPDDIVISTRTTAALLVADKLKQNPETVLASHSTDLNGLVSKLETAFSEDVASFSGSVFQMTEIVDEIDSSTETIKAGGGGQTMFLGGNTASGTASATAAPPVVTLVSPASGTTILVGSDVSLTAVASDSDGSIVKVSFYEGENKIGEASGVPYSFLWKNVPAGYYTLSAKAMDNAGLIGISPKVRIHSTIEPVLALTQPFGNTSLTLGNNILLSAVASGVPASMIKIEFYENNQKLGEVASPPYQFTWVTPSEGAHSVTAKMVFIDPSQPQDPLVSQPAVVTVIPKALVLPEIQIISPASNTMVPIGSDVTITVTASCSSGAPAKVEYYVGIIKIGESLSAPFSFVWANPAAGDYSLTAKVTDILGNEGRSGAIPISVAKVTNLDPTIKIISPLNGATVPVGSPVQILVSAQDADGQVVKVEFFQGSQKIGESTVSPFNFSWLPSQAGQFSLTARATDSKGATKLSTTCSLTVGKASNIAPSVSLSSPTTNSTKKAGSDVLLIANATDQDGTVIKVQFFSNSTKIGEVATAPFQFLYKSIPVGTLKLSALATDDSGAANMSAEVTILSSTSAP